MDYEEFISDTIDEAIYACENQFELNILDGKLEAAFNDCVSERLHDLQMHCQDRGEDIDTQALEDYFAECSMRLERRLYDIYDIIKQRALEMFEEEIEDIAEEMTALMPELKSDLAANF